MFKKIKDSKRSNLGGGSPGRLATLYTSAKLDEVQLLREPDASENSFNDFGDDNIK